MIFLNILIRDLILFGSEIKHNYKKNIVIFILYLFLNIFLKIDYSNIFAIILFLLYLIIIIKKNIAIDHYDRLKFALLRYEIVFLYQILSYIIILIFFWLFFLIFSLTFA